MRIPRLPKPRALNLPWRQPDIVQGPIRLNGRNLFILPTRLGLMFTLLLVGLLIGSANYGIALGYLFTFLLSGLGTVSLFHTQRNLAGLTLTPGHTPPVFVGETAACPLRIAAANGLPRHAVSIVGKHGETLLDIPAAGQGNAVIPARPFKRGLYPVGRLTLSSTWPLGLFRCWTVVHPDWSVLTYPAPAPVFWPLPKPSEAGRSGSGERAGDDTFAGLRGYHPGDSPRHIAWKAVARGLALQTKQFSGQAGGPLWLDWQNAPERDVEARLSRMTRWILDVENTGQAWGMRLPNRTLPAGRGEAHLKSCLEALALYET